MTVANNQMAQRGEEVIVVHNDENVRVLGVVDVATVLQAVIGEDSGSR